MTYKNCTILMIPLLCIIIFLSCDKESKNINEEEEMVNIEQENCDTITYNNSIKSIIAKNCLSCHGNSTSPNLVGYENVKSKAERIHVRAVETMTMPPSSDNILNKEDRDKITCWINSGMKE